jgi:hypothetical protein
MRCYVATGFKLIVRGAPASAGAFSGIAHTRSCKKRRNAFASSVVANSRSMTR